MEDPTNEIACTPGALSAFPLLSLFLVIIYWSMKFDGSLHPRTSRFSIHPQNSFASSDTATPSSAPLGRFSGSVSRG